ncbi:unnamed protein product [Rotaria sp. Silwood1]|nr:unnamed protein product [Rotaria sp. Silwood1]
MSKSPSTPKSSISDIVTRMPTLTTTNIQHLDAQHLNGDDKKRAFQKTHQHTKTQSKPKHTTSAVNYRRVSAHDIENEEPRSTFIPHNRGRKKHRSIFEKVDLHSGRTTYLGCGSFSQLEDCISDCLTRDQRHKSIEIYATKRSDPLRCFTRASVLEDYCYDGIILPKCCKIRSTSCDPCRCDYCVVGSRSCDPCRCDYCVIRSSSCDPYCCDYYKKCAGELSLPEIREVNDALDKCGISVFSRHLHSDHKSHTARDIASACELLLSDPQFAAYKHGSPAVSHVWDAMRHYQPPPAVANVWDAMRHYQPPPVAPSYPPPSLPPSYPPPSLPPPPQLPYGPSPGGVPNIFNPPPQPPYNPGQMGAPNMFGPPQPPPSSSGSGVLSRLFGGGGGGGPQQPPPPMPPPMLPPSQPQQPPSGAGQSVLSRLFGGGGGGPH